MAVGSAVRGVRVALGEGSALGLAGGVGEAVCEGMGVAEVVAVAWGLGLAVGVAVEQIRGDQGCVTGWDCVGANMIVLKSQPTHNPGGWV